MRKLKSALRQLKTTKADSRTRKLAGANAPEPPLDAYAAARGLLAGDDIPTPILDDLRPLLCARSLQDIATRGLSSGAADGGLSERKRSVEALTKGVGRVVAKYLLPDVSHRRGRPRQLARDVLLYKWHVQVHLSYAQIARKYNAELAAGNQHITRNTVALGCKRARRFFTALRLR